MQYLVISDLHSNLEALEAVLTAANGAYEQVICCGDVVGYGPNPNEVISKLLSLHAVIIRGNHDKAASGLEDADLFNESARAATFWTRVTLTPAYLTLLHDLPAGPFVFEEDHFQLVHGSIRDEDEYIFDEGTALEDLEAALIPITFFGHTHYQGFFALDGKGRLSRWVHDPEAIPPFDSLKLEQEIRYLINPGSVGQPRDGDPRTAFALFDSEARQIVFRRVEYDIKAVQEKMRAFQLPSYLIKRLTYGQ